MGSGCFSTRMWRRVRKRRRENDAASGALASGVADPYVSPLKISGCVDKFDFAIFTAIPLRNPQNIYWTLDQTPIYSSFDKDFGPPNMGQLYRFCLYVKDSVNVRRSCLSPIVKTRIQVLTLFSPFCSLQKCVAQSKRFVFYSYESTDLSPRTNAVFLVGAYAVRALFFKSAPYESSLTLCFLSDPHGKSHSLQGSHMVCASHQYVPLLVPTENGAKQKKSG